MKKWERRSLNLDTVILAVSEMNVDPSEGGLSKELHGP
jgi:hypothetical protein